MAFKQNFDETLLKTQKTSLFQKVGLLIVGVDSGTWRAFAVLDFNGSLVALKSRKNWLPEDFIKVLSDFFPTIIACDRNPPPRKVLVLKSVFGARLWFPRKNLTLVQKLSLTDGFSLHNSHERDALASALKAFNIVKSKLRVVEKKARAAGVPAARREFVKKMVLKGESVAEAIKSVV
ncbi:MAG TPA: DUF460 domain-containing protein [Candidatus Norongarragalinales archaeon]|nr:DUF460 domain-containing protein [Candidatus Norongarragalinales archaeon]